MKHKRWLPILVLLTLALTSLSWSQSAAETKSEPAPAAKASCPCCPAASETKTGACCAHHEKGEMCAGEACCGGKDKACMKADHSAGMGCCGTDHEKGCSMMAGKNGGKGNGSCCAKCKNHMMHDQDEPGAK